MAPELLLSSPEQSYYSFGVDIWSLGCVFAEMCTNKYLFPGDTEISMLFKIFKILGTPDAETWPGMTKLEYFSSNKFPDFRDTYFSEVLEKWDWRCQQKEEDASVEEGSWIHSMLHSMLRFDPAHRLTARELRAIPTPF